jgi:site-specific DNA-methyltransferase (adenine-specific)/modification methylase
MPAEPRPYYRTPDGAITVYHARWEDVVAADLVPLNEVELVHADVPYGVKERTERLKAGRVGSLARHSQTIRTGTRRAGLVGLPHDFDPIEGDDRPFDPAPLLALDRPSVLWGANHYSDKVPGSPSWILWDKRETQPSDDNADGELAWSNLGGPLRIFRHWWRGALRKTEKEDRHLGPTQKPVALSVWLFTERYKVKPGSLVFVPCMGSGPDLAACLKLGLRCIACDVSLTACRTAVSARLRAVPHAEEPAMLGPLFTPRG